MDTSYDKIEVEVDEKGQKHEKTTTFINYRIRKEVFNRKEMQRVSFQKKWKNGFVCPKCGSIHYCELSNGLYQCNDCHHQTSVTAGTILHRTHVPLTKWFFDILFCYSG